MWLILFPVVIARGLLDFKMASAATVIEILLRFGFIDLLHELFVGGGLCFFHALN